ncbi:hypothetical protein C4K27_5436 [Pseudomonas chlororaphis subsp. chlororaphis]|nr:hypothetical protein C4K27_5436 [Pseudomonas chlororaphis subsp. chlororaphis]
MSSAGAVYARVSREYKGKSENWHDRSDQWCWSCSCCRRLR